MEKITLLLFRPRCGKYVSEVWRWAKTRQDIEHEIQSMNALPKDPDDRSKWTAEVVEFPFEDERYALSLAGWLRGKASGSRTSAKKAASSVANGKKGGRPKKAIVVSEPVPKKPRGRPRKLVVVVPPEEPSESSEEPAVEVPTASVKKSRGRPRKLVAVVHPEEPSAPSEEPAAETPTAPVKKSRGRPKKIRTIEV